MKRTITYTSNPFTLLLGTAFFLALLPMSYTFTANEASSFEKMLGFVSLMVEVPIVILAATLSFLSILKISPKLKLNDIGIYDSRFTKNYIRWSEIEFVSFISERNTTKMQLNLWEELAPSRCRRIYKMFHSKQLTTNAKVLKIDIDLYRLNQTELKTALSEKAILKTIV